MDKVDKQSEKQIKRFKERCELMGEYLTENHATVRNTAERFGISKSTVHKDITERLSEVNPGLCAEVRDILEKNKSERHLRGGEATRKKYMKISQKLRKIYEE